MCDPISGAALAGVAASAGGAAASALPILSLVGSAASAGLNYMGQQATQQANQQVWNSPDSLTFLGDGRLRYEFREDRIVIRYLNPSRAEQEQTMWLGNFDTLEAPVHNGTAYWIKLSAKTDGSFTVTNARNGFTKTYAAPKPGT